MKFFSDIRLLMLAIWLGAAFFFIGVAQSAFAVLPQRELAGAVVNRNLAILNYSGLVISVLLILTSFVASSTVNRFWLWVERVLLGVITIACVVGQFVLGFWLASIRTQIGRPIDDVAADDPLRLQFNMVHEYSVWVLFVGLAAGLLTFFIIANRKFGKAAPAEKADVYDFSKEFKV